MAELITHNAERIETIYQLLGDKENDITRAIAWTLKKCPSFLCAFTGRIHSEKIDPESTTILYQQFEKTGSENGYTDLEITDETTFHIILEAKRGWILPGRAQLTKYAYRPSFINGRSPNKYIVTVSECSQDYANSYLPFKETDNGIPVSHISWKELKTLTETARAGANHEQKHLLEEFAKYLGGIMSMQNKTSNYVYVVALKNQNMEGKDFSWVDIVNKTQHYFCPVGVNGWPKEAPNYIGFRYGGRLQSIHHVEGYTITKNVHDVIDIMPDEDWETDHFVFNLGPAIVPAKTVKTGNIYPSGRVWAMIDTLLTCDTISEARDLSQQRQKE